MVGRLMGDSSDDMAPKGEMDSHMETLKGLADDVMAALEKKSASDFARAMKAFVSECDANEDSEQEG